MCFPCFILVLLKTKSISKAKTESSAYAGKSSATSASSTFSLKFTSEDNSEIGVKNAKEPIDFKIPRPTGFQLPDFQLVNISNMTLPPAAPFYSFQFVIQQQMSAVFVQIKPSNLTLAYLVWTEFGSLPVLNSTRTVLCPDDLRVMVFSTQKKQILTQKI